jgi:adenosylcobinamide-GDP ribazoletransferase
VKGLLLAIRFLTRLPVPHVTASDAEFAASMRWFPAVGLLLGTLIAGGTALAARIDPWTGALAGLVLWVTLTGALHLDGLGDIADAVGAAHKDKGKDPALLTAVLHDPHVGSFAVTAIALQLIAKLVLLHALIHAGAIAAVIGIAGAARIGPLLWARLLPSLHSGLASRFAPAIRPVDIALWSAALLAALAVMPGLIAAPLLFALWAVWLRRAIGGISGDGHGAGIEIVETGLLLATLLATFLAPLLTARIA